MTTTSATGNVGATNYPSLSPTSFKYTPEMAQADAEQARRIMDEIRRDAEESAKKQKLILESLQAHLANVLETASPHAEARTAGPSPRVTEAEAAVAQLAARPAAAETTRQREKERFEEMWGIIARS